MTANFKAMCIGFWRNGMKPEEIAAIVNLPVFEIEGIVIQYLNK